MQFAMSEWNISLQPAARQTVLYEQRSDIDYYENYTII
jgi:hypothetical protein